MWRDWWLVCWARPIPIGLTREHHADLFEPLLVGSRQIFRREIDPAAGDGSLRKSTLTQRTEKSCNIRLEWVFVYTSAAQAVGNR